MERSAELDAVMHRWWDAFRTGDTDTVFGMLSDAEDVLWVGSDPGEEWSGRAVIDAVMGSQIQEVGGTCPFRVVSQSAWRQGDVGWCYTSLFVDFDFEPEPVPFRATSVLRLEKGNWRIVHTLWAAPVPNAEFIGVELTTSVDRVAQAVEVERPDLSSITALDGTVTLLFTDIEGSTERNAVLGDREWMSMLRQHHDVVREQVAASGGFEVKSMGDGFMLAFASARKALQCAIDIQRAIEKEEELDIAIRAGLHAGEAVRLGDDFYGGVVNMAARVAGAARGGEVLASSLVKGLVEACGDFAFAEPRSADLKGISGAQLLHPVLL